MRRAAVRSRGAQIIRQPLHSDQGSRYTASLFRGFLRERTVRQPFSKPGGPYDNSIRESFFHTKKKPSITIPMTTQSS